MWGRDRFANAEPGDLVLVTIREGGYWKDLLRGRFLGLTEKRVKVNLSGKVRYFGFDSVELRKEG